MNDAPEIYPESFGVLAEGEAAPVNLGDLRNDHEALRIDLLHQTLKLDQLAAGDDAQDDLRGGLGVAALAVQERHAPVHTGEDGGADLPRLAGDDLDLCAAGAQHEHLVQHNGVDDGQERGNERNT